MDSSQKRDRDRKNRQRRQDKEARRRERTALKRQERLGLAPGAVPEPPVAVEKPSPPAPPVEGS